MHKLKKVGSFLPSLGFMLFTACMSLTGATSSSSAIAATSTTPEQEAGALVVTFLSNIMQGKTEQALEMIDLPLAEDRATFLGKLNAITPGVLEGIKYKGGLKQLVVEDVIKLDKEGQYLVQVRTELGNGESYSSSQTVITKNGKMYIIGVNDDAS